MNMNMKCGLSLLSLLDYCSTSYSISFSSQASDNRDALYRSGCGTFPVQTRFSVLGGIRAAKGG